MTEFILLIVLLGVAAMAVSHSKHKYQALRNRTSDSHRLLCQRIADYDDGTGKVSYETNIREGRHRTNLKDKGEDFPLLDHRLVPDWESPKTDE